jgi:hypothetical protein
MSYSLDITLTEFKYLTVTVALCSGSSSLKNPYVTAVPIYTQDVLFVAPALGRGKLYNELGNSVDSVTFSAGSPVRRDTYSTRVQLGVTYTDIYLYAVSPQTIPVSPNGTTAIFALPFGAQSKSWNNADNPSKYLITLFNTGEPDATGVTTPSVLVQGYLTLPPPVSDGGGGGSGGGSGGGGYSAPTICNATWS